MDLPRTVLAAALGLLVTLILASGLASADVVRHDCRADNLGNCTVHVDSRTGPIEVPDGTVPDDLGVAGVDTDNGTVWVTNPAAPLLREVFEENRSALWVSTHPDEEDPDRYYVVEVCPPGVENCAVVPIPIHNWTLDDDGRGVSWYGDRIVVGAGLQECTDDYVDLGGWSWRTFVGLEPNPFPAAKGAAPDACIDVDPPSVCNGACEAWRADPSSLPTGRVDPAEPVASLGTSPRTSAVPSTPDGTVRTSVGPPPVDRVDPHPGLLVAVAGITAAIGLAYVLYAREEDDGVLGNGTRVRIHELLAEEPGLIVAEIARRLDIHYTTAEYHLEILAEHDLVVRKRSGGKERVFPSDLAPQAEVIALERSPKRRRIFETVRAAPGISRCELAKHLDLSRDAVAYHTDVLAEDGLVVKEKDRGEIIVYPDADPEGA